MTKCQICRAEYIKQRMMQKCCEAIECLIIIGRKKTIADAQKAERIANKIQKEKSKSSAEYKDEAQKAINKYIKFRDWGKPCISCDRPHMFADTRHASHFKSVGSSSFLRFNLWNINMSCHSCNWKKGGNIANYIPRLREKIGFDKVEYLLIAPKSRIYSKEYLIRLKRVFAKKTLRAEKRINKG